MRVRACVRVPLLQNGFSFHCSFIHPVTRLFITCIWRLWEKTLRFESQFLASYKIWCTSITVLWGCTTAPEHGQALLADSWMPPSARWPWWQRLHICAWIQNASKWKHFFNYSETKWITTLKRYFLIWVVVVCQLTRASSGGFVSLTGFCSSPTV